MNRWPKMINLFIINICFGLIKTRKIDLSRLFYLICFLFYFIINLSKLHFIPSHLNLEVSRLKDYF